MIFSSVKRYGEPLGKTARILDIPEATLRRKVIRMREQYGDQPPERPDNWVSVDSILDDLVQTAKERGVSVPELLSKSLLKEVSRRELNKSEGATLMGVSLPTYRRMSP